MEIERKWRIDPAAVPAEILSADGEPVEQGYLAIEPEGREVRLRRRAGRCSITVKTGGGLVREELESELEPEQFESLWPGTLGRRVEKVRRVLDGPSGVVELDVFGGSLDGLVVAEVEFADEGAAAGFEPPAWFGPEVTGQPQYANQRLAVDGLPQLS